MSVTVRKRESISNGIVSQGRTSLFRPWIAFRRKRNNPRFSILGNVVGSFANRELLTMARLPVSGEIVVLKSFTSQQILMLQSLY